jgi:hypothetical protein
VHGGQQVGYVNALSRASLWSGTAASWVDLHAFLPAEFNHSSIARGIWHDGTSTYVVGKGFNSTTGRDEALLWVGPAAPVPCYANCDGSTGTPILTGNDFQCFINLFASGSSSANCDGSTGMPMLTGNDFQCFIDAYVAGCS